MDLYLNLKEHSFRPDRINPLPLTVLQQLAINVTEQIHNRGILSDDFHGAKAEGCYEYCGVQVQLIGLVNYNDKDSL